MNQTKSGAAAPTRHRVLVVDDHAIVREGLAQLINGTPDLTVCALAADAAMALALVATAHPDVALVDLSLPGKPGMELIKDLRACAPALPILVLSMHEEDLYAERALRAGARGYIMKQEPTAKILSAIRQVLGGGISVSPHISDRLLGQLSGTHHTLAGTLERLSDRELEVFALLGQGKGARDIAALLNLSVKTVEAHREHIKEKLGLGSAGELLRVAIQAALEDK